MREYAAMSAKQKLSTETQGDSLGVPGNQLILADSFRLIARMPTASVDLAYLDPPWFPHEPYLSSADADKSMRLHLLQLARVMEQVKRSLRLTGTLFVHSTPELNVHLRLLLDQIYGRENFRHEYILPHRVLGGRRPSHETVFFYSVGESFVFNPVFRRPTPDESRSSWTAGDPRGPYRLTALTIPAARPSLAFEWRNHFPPADSSWRFSRDRLEKLAEEGRIVFPAGGGVPRMKQYIADQPGIEVGSVWSDIKPSIRSAERVGLEAQKPVSLLERILEIGSHPGSLILDPYCGSGTTFVAAHRLDRRWIGGDNSPEAVAVTIERLHRDCELIRMRDFQLRDEATLMAATDEFPVFARAIVTGIDDLSQPRRSTYTLGERLNIDESREIEFKEVKGGNPLSAIANAADEYAVAFLNSQGGRVFWGVRDSDGRVVGVKLDQQERDRLRREVTSKLHSIQPQIDPTLFGFELHAAVTPDNDESGLYVVELVVPPGETSDPYYTSGHDMFVRVDGVKKRLTGPQLTAWIKQRLEKPRAPASPSKRRRRANGSGGSRKGHKPQ